MINEKQLNMILYDKFSYKNYIYNYLYNLLNTPLKSYLINIYNITDFPNESFLIALFYLNKIKYKIVNDDINICLFVCIIIANKQLLDEIINVEKMCNILNIKYSEYIKYEVYILNILNWDTFVNYDNIQFFKNLKCNNLPPSSIKWVDTTVIVN